jgi:hypothetical protein
MRAPWRAARRDVAADDLGRRVTAAREAAAARTRLPYWAEDWTIGPARAGRVSRLLLWCAGVDRAVLRTGSEALRYSGLGGLVVAVAALGATTFTVFAAVVMGHFQWYLVLFGLGWGLVILLIDRAIVTEPHYRMRVARAALQASRPGGAPPGPRRRWRRGGSGEQPAPEPASPVAAPPGTADSNGASVNGANGTNGASGTNAATVANGTNGTNGTSAATVTDGTNGTSAVTRANSANGANGTHGATSQAHPAVDLDTMRLPPDYAGWLVRGVIYLTRLAITCCIAFLVAEAAVLLIFHPEVTQQLEVTHLAQFQQQRAAEITRAVNGEKQPLQTLLVNWKTAETTVSGDEKTLQQYTDQADAEQEGRVIDGPNGQPATSGQPGAGERFHLDAGLVGHQEEILDTDRTAAAKAEKAYNTLNSEIQQVYQGNASALAQLNAPSLSKLKSDIYNDNGLDAQEHAFDAFLAMNKGDLLATYSPWALRGLLIAIDLVPLGTKLLNRFTIYGRRLSERALVIHYHDMARDNAVLRDIDQQAAIHDLHAEHDFDVEAERVGWRTSWRMNHLRLPE